MEALPAVTREDRDWLFSMLKLGPVQVTFTKADGSERVMNCSLQKGVVPEYERKTEAKSEGEAEAKPKNEDIMFVWDLDKSSWRSFKLSTIKHVQLTTE